MTSDAFLLPSIVYSQLAFNKFTLAQRVPYSLVSKLKREAEMRRKELIIAYAAVFEGNAKKADPLIKFLERDDYRFGTGYAKEAIWRGLKKV